MADPLIMNVSRDIYEAFWRQGQLPLTRTIRVKSVCGDGKAKVAAFSCEIPAEFLGEMTIDELQAQLDTLPVRPVMRWSIQ